MKATNLLLLSIVPLLVLAGCEKAEDVALKALERDNFKFKPTEFVRAAAMGDEITVANFVEAKMDINTRNEKGDTALFAAAERGHTRTVKLLLEKGARPDEKAGDAWTPLMTASFNGHSEVVRVLLEHGADLEQTDNSGWTALMQAVYRGNAESVALLASNGSRNLDRALLVGGLMGHADVIPVLVKAGADINTTTEEGDTPLILAVQKGRHDAVAAILRSGADKSKANNVGDTALAIALERNMPDLAELIRKAEIPATPPSASPPTTPALAKAAEKETGKPVVVADSPSSAPANPLGMPAPMEPEAPTMSAAPPAPIVSQPETNEEPVSLAAASPATAETTVPEQPVGIPGQPVGLPVQEMAQGTTEVEAPALPTGESITADDGALLGQGDSMESGEAWFKRYQLDLSDPNMLGSDSDGDGFPNRAEFLADTNPRDAASHPSKVVLLEMKAYEEQSLPYLLKGVSGGVASISNREGGTYQLRTGERIPGTDWKISGVRSRSSMTKEGTWADLSEVTLTNTSSGVSTTLVRGLPARAGESYALLQFPPSSQTFRLQSNQEFVLPGEESIRYQVVDIRPTQVVLRETQSGRTHTISKTSLD